MILALGKIIDKEIDLFCDETFAIWSENGIVDLPAAAKNLGTSRVHQHRRVAPFIIRFSMVFLIFPPASRRECKAFWGNHEKNVFLKAVFLIRRPLFSYIACLFSMALAAEYRGKE